MRCYFALLLCWVGAQRSFSVNSSAASSGLALSFLVLHSQSLQRWQLCRWSKWASKSLPKMSSLILGKCQRVSRLDLQPWSAFFLGTSSHSSFWFQRRLSWAPTLSLEEFRWTWVGSQTNKSLFETSLASKAWEKASCSSPTLLS